MGSPVYSATYAATYSGGFSYMTDSLIIGESIELIGAPGGTVSANPLCAGASFQLMVAAREVLMQEINQQTWTLRWTRDTSGAYAGNTTALPILFDCFRAQ